MYEDTEQHQNQLDARPCFSTDTPMADGYKIYNISHPPTPTVVHLQTPNLQTLASRLLIPLAGALAPAAHAVSVTISIRVYVKSNI